MRVSPNRELLAEIGFIPMDVTWAPSMGGETSKYFAKHDGTIDEAVAFCKTYEIAYDVIDM